MSTAPLVAPDTLAQTARPLPVVIVFDWSWSMRHFTDQIERVLRKLPSEFDRRALLRNSGEVALITMNHEGAHGVTLRTGVPTQPPFGFVRASEFVVPISVTCDGTTELDRALELALAIVERRCEQIAAAGRSFFRPYLTIISDGDPTDDQGAPDDDRWRQASERVRQAVGGKLSVEAFVPETVDPGMLTELVGTPNRVHSFNPSRLAEVIEAVSFSAERGASDAPTPTAIVREDLRRRSDVAPSPGSDR